MALPMSNCVLTDLVTDKLDCFVNLLVPSRFNLFCLAVLNARLFAAIVDETAF